MSLQIRTEPIRIIATTRGQLIKAWPRPNGGEIYVVEVLPGQPRGNHFHRYGGEWFVPLQGTVHLKVVDPETNTRATIVLDGIRARVEPGQAHALEVVGNQSAWVMAIADVHHVNEETTPFMVSSP